jgi:hypothetical protein
MNARPAPSPHAGADPAPVVALHPVLQPLAASDAYQRLLERPGSPRRPAASGGEGPSAPVRAERGRVLVVDFRSGQVLGARP